MGMRGMRDSAREGSERPVERGGVRDDLHGGAREFPSLAEQFDELDPTHVCGIDIGFKGVRAGEKEFEEIEARGFRRPCEQDEIHSPCDCQEMTCEEM